MPNACAVTKSPFVEQQRDLDQRHPRCVTRARLGLVTFDVVASGHSLRALSAAVAAAKTTKPRLAKRSVSSLLSIRHHLTHSAADIWQAKEHTYPDMSSRSILAPSRLKLGSSSEGATAARPAFHGLKASKLGSALAQSKSEGGDRKSEESNENVNCVAAAKFIPLAKTEESATSVTETTTPITTTTTTSSGFVFGHNLVERAQNFSDAVKRDEDADKADKSAAKEAEEDDKEAEKESEEESKEAKKDSTPTKSLSESADAYLKQMSQHKKHYDRVRVVTGEEAEENVLHMSAKLFVFDKTNWVERGRGSLRLNDTYDGMKKSRLVMRTDGSLRVILNSAVYSGMVLERPSEKTLRLTASEDEQVRVFLVAASVQDVQALYQALEERVRWAKACQNEQTEDDKDNKRRKDMAEDVKDVKEDGDDDEVVDRKRIRQENPKDGEK